MRRIVGAAFVSVDGVIQGPGGADEDRSGGFDLGGWVFGAQDEAIFERVDALFSGAFDLLLGRRTYDIFAAYWPFQPPEPGGIGERFDRAGKYVLTTGDQPLPWAGSHRVAGMAALAALKATDGPDLIIQGSSTLYPQLLAAGLLDRVTLMVFPLVLGPGKRLFGEGTQASGLRLVEHKVTARGTVIATYEPAGAVATGSFEVVPPTPMELERRRKVAAGVW